MRDRAELASELTEMLNLDRPPIAVAFVEEQPAGTPLFDSVVPAACAFWTRAEEGTFFATPEQHFNCPVGAMTMGFDMPDELRDTLMGLVGKMNADCYLEASEPANIPSVSKAKAGVVYGPLAEAPVESDAVLMWLDPTQAMVYNEAAGTVRWADQMPSPIFGRPTCAAIAVAHEESRPTMSLGCIGMRTFTGIGADRMLAVVPAAAVDDFVAALTTAVAANRSMQDFYEGHKLQFAG
jgi:uncharacterized protein (DUF169 family)